MCGRQWWQQSQTATFQTSLTPTDRPMPLQHKGFGFFRSPYVGDGRLIRGRSVIFPGSHRPGEGEQRMEPDVHRSQPVEAVPLPASGGHLAAATG